MATPRFLHLLLYAAALLFLALPDGGYSLPVRPPPPPPPPPPPRNRPMGPSGGGSTSSASNANRGQTSPQSNQHVPTGTFIPTGNPQAPPPIPPRGRDRAPAGGIDRVPGHGSGNGAPSSSSPSSKTPKSNEPDVPLNYGTSNRGGGNIAPKSKPEPVNQPGAGPSSLTAQRNTPKPDEPDISPNYQTGGTNRASGPKAPLASQSDKTPVPGSDHKTGSSKSTEPDVPLNYNVGSKNGASQPKQESTAQPGPASVKPKATTPSGATVDPASLPAWPSDKKVKKMYKDWEDEQLRNVPGFSIKAEARVRSARIMGFKIRDPQDIKLDQKITDLESNGKKQFQTQVLEPIL
ncbi:hypothetical protein CP532_2185 [Ophiocordyceps camponoti-leonardi (nom. inval.)]|nr:hypothetical protein CP532_2185 [Ophiocordyceps camponoti-leonardi (nom. inval.)]